MTRMVYEVPVNPDVRWEENLYHAVVPVVGGYVDVDDPMTIDALLNLGFVFVPNEPETDAPNDEDDEE